MRTSIYLFFLSVLLFSCKNETTNNENTSVSNQQTGTNQEVVVNQSPNDIDNNTPDTLDKTPEVENSSEVESKAFLLSMLKQWNERINQEKYNALAEMYADNVLYYTQEISKEKVIQSKKDYIANEYGYYHQELKDVMLELPDEDSNTIRFSFLKKYDGEIKSDSVHAKLIFNKRADGKYEIIEETDILSELKRIKSLETKNLQQGIHHFTYSYLLDTRNTISAWDNVPYYDDLTITYKGDNNVDVSFHSYSGASRTATSFETRNAAINDGILTFQAAPTNDKYEHPREDDYQSFTFKILDSNKVAFINNDGWFSSSLGNIFWRVENE